MSTDTLTIKGVRYRRIGRPFQYMAEAARFARTLRENGYLSFRRGYDVYSAAPTPSGITAHKTEVTG